MENKTVFKVGQDVYCGLLEKWGKVTEISQSEDFAIKVEWDDEDFDSYTLDGRYYINSIPTLSFTEYKIQGVDQTPPRKPYEVGDVVYDADKNVAGKVVDITEAFSYPIVVEFKEGNDTNTRTYTEKGFKHEKDRFPKLSYTPYDYKNGGFT